jgi:hypothetical protein
MKIAEFMNLTDTVAANVDGWLGVVAMDGWMLLRWLTWFP